MVWPALPGGEWQVGRWEGGGVSGTPATPTSTGGGMQVARGVGGGGTKVTEPLPPTTYAVLPPCPTGALLSSAQPWCVANMISSPVQVHVLAAGRR